MQSRNRYYRRSRISEYKFRLLVRYFALDLSA
ncbi:MAG TPA: IS1595 family transposase, partial [Pyrinomonadaceae bacterium]